MEAEIFQKLFFPAIKNRIEEMVKEEIEVSVMNLRRKIPEIVAAVGLEVLKEVRMDRIGSEIVIRMKIMEK